MMADIFEEIEREAPPLTWSGERATGPLSAGPSAPR